ncbi:MAG: glycosyltransferase family 4 protein [Porticoccaceae bacterium]
MTAAIYFHPEGYSTSGPRLMGRNAAGESFLRGFLQYSRTDTFWAQVPRKDFGPLFAQAVRAAGRTEPVRVVDDTSLAGLQRPGAVYHPGPGIGQQAWIRSVFGHGRWSLCGITHTTSSAGAMDSITELLTAPVQPWDAVICTSRAVKNNVSRVLGAQAEYLASRFGVRRMPEIQLPVIPLGIHTKDFVFSDPEKVAARKAIGADADTLVVLFMGRLSFHAKAHPLAMYQALEQAAASLPEGKKVVLVECGWHGNGDIARAFNDAAALACPSVRVVNLDGRKADERKTAWAGADIFCSLSDNIQETFGIVPIEAMAAGLPVVVSDWDGYKDTVRDGIEGFRIPTLMPGAGAGRDLALRHALGIDTYDMYCGHTCSLIAVDIEAAAHAFAQLFASAGLRRKMAEAGLRRAREIYDWSVIIPQYEDLWERQARQRAEGAAKIRPLAAPWPARMDPFAGFAAYPTRTLTRDSVLELADSDVDAAIARVRRLRRLKMVDFAVYVLPEDSDVEIMLRGLDEGPKAVALLLGQSVENRPRHYFRALAWLVKLGVVRVVAMASDSSAGD